MCAITTRPLRRRRPRTRRGGAASPVPGCDRALLLVGFAGAFRRSELLAIDVEHLDFTTDRGVLVALPKSKTDQERAGATPSPSTAVATRRSAPCGRCAPDWTPPPSPPGWCSGACSAATGPARA
jgi:hypothetical protein